MVKIAFILIVPNTHPIWVSNSLRPISSTVSVVFNDPLETVECSFEDNDNTSPDNYNHAAEANAAPNPIERKECDHNSRGPHMSACRCRSLTTG